MPIPFDDAGLNQRAFKYASQITRTRSRSIWFQRKIIDTFWEYSDSSWVKKPDSKLSHGLAFTKKGLYRQAKDL
jgi:hypothetical protein